MEWAGLAFCGPSVEENVVDIMGEVAWSSGLGRKASQVGLFDQMALLC